MTIKDSLDINIKINNDKYLDKDLVAVPSLVPFPPHHST